MINYYLITKPGIVFGNLVTLAAGFMLASKGSFNIRLFLITLLGLAFVMASACVFNNYIDRKMDKKMERTKKRALVTGLISGSSALLFGTVLGIIGGAILFFYTNLLAFSVAAFGFFVYVFLYSMWKGKTVYGTAIGSVAGAVPPVVGYCAVSNQVDMGAIILFSMLVLWQMPHFFAIAMSHFDDYTAAGVPVLPILKGSLRAKIHMVFYILAFIIASALLTLFNYTGIVYLTISTGLGCGWLVLSLKGFGCQDDQLWGRRMFQVSLVLIMAICLTIPFDLVM